MGSGGRPFVDDGRRGGVWEGLDCISPLAAFILLVNDEIAHPAQPVSFWGVLMRGGAPLVVVGGGRTESGRVLAYFRIRWT